MVGPPGVGLGLGGILLYGGGKGKAGGGYSSFDKLRMNNRLGVDGRLLWVGVVDGYGLGVLFG